MIFIAPMNKAILSFIFAIFGFCSYLILKPSPSPTISNAIAENNSAPVVYNIEIKGSPKFEDQIKKALALIQQKSPEAYDVIQHYVGRIEQGNHSGMHATRTPPTYEMGDKTTFYSLTWCAGTIVHDSFHSKLYHDYLRTNSVVPYDIWTGQQAELKCNAWQLKAMAKIGSPKNEIDHVERDDGTHYDLNKNGKYDAEDDKLRNW
jgi:hypothetical protein